MFTEEEAKTRWCPMVRTCDEGSNGALPYNRPDIDRLEKLDCHCIGSNCMMWRWIDKQINPSTGNPLPDKYGYCGLAGNDR